MSSAIPLGRTGWLPASFHERDFSWVSFRGCRHFFMFRPPSLLASQIAPTAMAMPSGGRGFYVRAERASSPPHAPDMLAVRKQVIDGARTHTLLDSQHCRLLPFPPHSPPTRFRLCSSDSSVLCRSVTPQRRTRGPCGLGLRPPTCCRTGRRCLRGLPVLVHEVSRRAWGLRLRRTEQGLALSPLLMLPSAHIYCVGVRVVSFRSSIAHPAYTPIYASLCPSR
jgi:hypothetical protein